MTAKKVYVENELNKRRMFCIHVSDEIATKHNGYARGKIFRDENFSDYPSFPVKSLYQRCFVFYDAISLEFYDYSCKVESFHHC